MKKNSKEHDIINIIKMKMSVFYDKKMLSSMPAELLRTIEDIIELVKKNQNVLSSLSTLKTYDRYTFSHSINVFFLSMMTGYKFSFSKVQLLDLGMSALLHDIGKASIPKRILNKKTKLTNLELEIVKTHASNGYFFVKENIRIPDISFVGILYHHEKFDGTGYPVGVKGEKIDIFGRIIAIADVYDAITSDRPYRKALTHSKAMDCICANSGKYFDPQVVNAFADCVEAFSELFTSGKIKLTFDER